MNVTRAHYDQLQNVLNRKYMGRDDAEDNGDHNVLSEKLELLWSLPACPNDNDTEASDNDVDMDSSHDDDPEIFPFSFKFLDLSTLNLETISGRFPPQLLLREEYYHLSRLMDKGPPSGLNSFIVSGQPGTGELLVSLSHRL